jgi:hypothetical protein
MGSSDRPGASPSPPDLRCSCPSVQPGLDRRGIEDQPDDVLVGQAAGTTRASRSTFTWREPRLTLAMGLEPMARKG